MNTISRPADYSEGYGELVRAYRLYLGVSQRTMADKIGMTERSLSDIEIGRRRCPPGFIDSVEKIVDEYDHAVDAVVKSVESLPEPTLPVSADPAREWQRAVIGRAAVTSGLLRPILEPE